MRQRSSSGRARTPWTGVRGALRCAMAPVAALVLVGCAEDRGVVELNWVFVDRTGEPMFPAGQFSPSRRKSSCSFDGADLETTTKVDVQVEFRICDPTCDGGCTDPTCQVVDPKLFSCDVSRGSNPEVPSSNDPYRFSIEAVLRRHDTDQECRDLPPECIVVPGPRERAVEQGLVTDLQVYQIKLALDAGADSSEPKGRLDLGDCVCTA